MRSATLSGAMKIPVQQFKPKALTALKSLLTYSYQPMGEDPVEVKGYMLDGDFIHLPRQHGLELCNQLQIPWEDETAQGVTVKFPKVPTARDYQVGTLDEIMDVLQDDYDVLFRAHTGWGKTIGALICAVRFGRNTVVIVDQDNLKQQWLDVLTNPKLFGLKESQVGLIQGPRCDYQGKLVTIAMVQTLVQKEADDPLFHHFGFLIGDEVHTLGAPTFSQVLLRFAATARLFVSATPRRRDGLQKALDYNCGHLKVSADKEHEESKVYILRNDKVYSWYGNVSPKVGRIINEVAEDGRRNLMICEAAVWLWESGRDLLILSDRIEHLRNLKAMLAYAGIPEREIGLYAGYHPAYALSKNPTPKRQPAGLHYEVDRAGERVYADYSPVTYQVQEKRVPKDKFKEIEQSCSVILATFGKFAKGVDVPRLAAGIDATPRSQAEQAQGRTKRLLDGKLQPIWVTVVDDNNYRLLHSFAGRVTEYARSNSRFYEWDGQRETREWTSKELLAEVRARGRQLEKEMEIRPDNQGGFELVKKTQQKKEKAKEAAEAIKKRFVGRRRATPT